MKAWISCRLDFFWLKLQKLKPEGFIKERLNSLGEVEFLVFTGKLLGGLCTPLGTICINRKLLGNCLLKELILLHEHSHKKDPLRFIFYSTGVFVLFFTFFGGWVGVFTTIVLAIFLSWVMELKAEVYTVKHMGKRYFKARVEMEKLRKGKPSPFYRLIYPPKKLEECLTRKVTLEL